MRAAFRLQDRLARHYGRFGAKAAHLIDSSDHFWLTATAILLRLAQWLVLIYLAFVIYSVAGRGHWPFSLHADTRLAVVEFETSRRIQWDVSDAALCLKHDLKPASDVYRRVNDAKSVIEHCGSRHLHAYLPAAKGGIAPQLSIELGSYQRAGRHAYTARFASLRDGRLIVRIAPASSTEPANLDVVGAGRVRASLPGVVTFAWRTSQATSLLFPFKGAVSIGQDVTTTRHALLEDGRIDVYSASDKEATGRSLIDSIDLLPGDHVKIRNDEEVTKGAPASGFVRFTPEAIASRWPRMTVIAFGLSNHIKIERYGEAGLDFSPSLWARLTHNNWIVIFSLILFGGLSILKTLAEAARLIRRTNTESPADTP